MNTIKLICLANGPVDASNQALLTAGNPHLDKEWVAKHIPVLAERLKKLEFSHLYSGNLHRMHEMAYELRRAGVRLPAVSYRYYLDVRDEDLRNYMGGQAHRLLHEAALMAGTSTVLVVTSGIILMALRAIARQLTFSSTEEMRAWIANGNTPEPGEVWIFELEGPDAIREMTLEELVGA